MGEFLNKFKPFSSIQDYQDKHYDNEWRDKIGLNKETLYQLHQGLKRELIELHQSIIKANNIDIVNEIADVVKKMNVGDELEMTILRKDKSIKMKTVLEERK